MSVQISRVKIADDGKSYVAMVSFSFSHEGLPLEVNEEYKGNDGKWKRTTKCRFVGADFVEVRNARILDGKQGLWVASSTQLPRDVERAVLDEFEDELSQRVDRQGTE